MFCKTLFGKHNWDEIPIIKRFKIVWYNSYGDPFNDESKVIIKRCKNCGKIIGKIYHSNGYLWNNLSKKELGIVLGIGPNNS